jgi:hypothetical protein
MESESRVVENVVIKLVLVQTCMIVSKRRTLLDIKRISGADVRQKRGGFGAPKSRG